QPRLREVRRVGQPVVTSADDDRVVGVRRGGHQCSIRYEIGRGSTEEPVLRAGLNNGIRSVVTGTVRDSWSTVISRWTVEPFAADSGSTRAMPMWRWSTGEYIRLVA